MARTRFLRNTASDCTGSEDNNDLFGSAPGTEETEQSSTGATEMNDEAQRFTTESGDLSTEDLASGDWSVVLDVTEATSPMVYRVQFAVLDDSCALQGSVQAMAEDDFSGTGTKTATATWDPPSGSRYQIRVLADGGGMHTDGAKLMTLRFDTGGTSVFTFPDAPTPPGGRTRRIFAVG